MDLPKLFINDYGRLRSGWRLLFFLFALISIHLLSSTVLRLAYAVSYPFVDRIPHAVFLANVIFRFNMLGSALLSGYLCNRFLEGLPWSALGLTLHKRWFRDLLVGSLVGSFSLAIATMIATAGGGLQFTVSSRGMLAAVAQTLVSSATLFIIAALAEEAMFRGYPLQTLSRAHLAWLGVLLTSVPFATVHLWNPNVVPFVTFANTALAGIWLGIAYLRTRSLWFPLGLHWAWNWALGSLFGLPVSGLIIANHSLLQGKDLGPAWLTGGTYGIEGGAACTVALLVSTVFIWRTHLVSSDPELNKLTSEENPASLPAVIPIDEQI
jgi:CAAX protease family protein